MQALKTIQEEATDLEQFGLNDPLCVIDMKLKNGEEKGIIIGDTTPTTKSAYYMKLKDSNTVYTISVWDVNNFLLTNKNL